MFHDRADLDEAHTSGKRAREHNQPARDYQQRYFGG